VAAGPAAGGFAATATLQKQSDAAVLLTGPACRRDSPPGYCGKLLVAGGSDGNPRNAADLYDPVRESWSDAGTLAVNRGAATLTLLDGAECRAGSPPGYCGKALLVGGAPASNGLEGNPTDPNARVELYDPADGPTGKWSSCGSAASASAACPAPYTGGVVKHHSATLLSDGRVLFAGGSRPNQGDAVISGRNDFYIYHPALGRWGPRGVLANGRARHRAVLLAGGSDKCGANCGRVLLVGGNGNGDGQTPNTAELLDPLAHASLPTPAMKVPRASGHSATLLPSGHVLVAGGRDICGDATTACTNAANKVEYFNSQAGEWTANAAPLLAFRPHNIATIFPAGKLLIAGGDTRNAELYDPFAPHSTASVLTDPAQAGPSRPDSATLLPSGPSSVCGTHCGKVLLTENSAKAGPSGEIDYFTLGWLYTPRPELTGVAPSSGPTAGGTKVTLEGRGLASATSVRFGTLEAVRLPPGDPDGDSPDTKLEVLSPAQPVAGTVPVTVTSSGGSAAISFTYTGDTGGGTGAPSAPGGTGTGTGTGAASAESVGSAGSGAGSGVGSGAGSGVGSGGGAAGIAAGGGSSANPVAAALAGERRRSRALRSCLAKARGRARGTRRGPARRRAVSRLGAGCRMRFGRTPGPVTGLSARAASATKIVLSFQVPGSDGARPPAARGYLVKQSTSPIKGSRAFGRARSLCGGTCRFSDTEVGTTVSLTIADLRPGTNYYYSVAALDNVSRRPGPRSRGVKVTTGG